MYANFINEVSSSSLSKDILDIIFYKRRLLASAEDGIDADDAFDHHLAKIETFIQTNSPIHMILPAFPAKSPNRRKTLSELPDRAEEIAIARLNTLCCEIQKIYSPGAKITICSDGRVFADLVRIPDSDITAYKTDLIARVCAPFNGVIDFFDLDDVFDGLRGYDVLREELMIQHGESLRALRDRSKSDPSAAAMYKGIVRFMYEDFSGLHAFAGKSNNAIQDAARSAAYRVIQRSNAWSRLLNERFPDAVRLSIHPQPRVSEKIGVFLVDSDDSWRTPWHSVAIRDGDRIHLVPRHAAESANAFLVYENGRPSHYLAASRS